MNTYVLALKMVAHTVERTLNNTLIQRFAEVCHMYTKQEASLFRQKFWTAFGKYMQPVPGANGEKLNWVNYKTGVKHVFFRMDANNKQATIGIQITHPDTTERHLVFEQMEGLRSILHSELQEEWNWQRDAYDENGKTISLVSASLEGVNIFNRETWPQLISFFKPRIIALDAFWDLVKDAFE